MTCIIIEDQPPAQRILKKYIEDMGTLTLEGVFSDAIRAMEFLKEREIDLIFLDIHLPKISGIDFLKAIPKKPNVIMTTAFPDYALESYEFDVVDYLLKPFSFQRFVKAVSKVPSKAKVDQRPIDSGVLKNEIFIKSGYEHIKITLDEIIFINSDADYTELHLPDKKHLSSESLRYWLENLNTDQFWRIHKSYIVNVNKIEKVVGSQVYLEHENVLPIGRTYKDAFVEKFLK